MTKSFRLLVLIHIREILRYPGVIFWVFVFPVLMAWVLGLAFSSKGQTIAKIAVLNSKQNSSVQFKNLLSVWGNEDFSDTKYKIYYMPKKEAIKNLKKGIVLLFVEELRPGALRFHLDWTNKEAMLSYYKLKTSLLESEVVENAKWTYEKQIISDKGGRYIDYLIPGLIALGILNSCMWGIGWSMIQMRMKKLLKRMIATPMSKFEFLTAPILVRAMVSFWEFGILFSFSYFYFGLTVQGSLTALILLILAGNLAFSGVAILASSQARNPQSGNGIMNAITLPMMILSGIFFSYHNFPPWLEKFASYLPLTILADGIRAVFNEGASLNDSLPAILALCLIGIITIIPGVKVFKWT